MARILAWALTGVITAAPLAACESVVAGPGSAGSSSSAICTPIDDEIDYARVKPQPRLLAEAIERANTDHLYVRRKAGADAVDARGDHILMFTWGSFMPGRSSLQAIRLNDGSWSVEQVNEGNDGAGGRLPPEAPYISRGTLTGAKAAELVRILGDRCLYTEPTYYSRTVPAPNGESMTCADGDDSLIEIKDRGRRHVSFHACHAYGRPARVSWLLQGAVQGPAPE